MPEESSGPRDIRIADEQHHMYQELTEDEASPFYETTKTDMFVFAMGYGFDQGLRTEITDSRRALFQIRDLSSAQDWNVRAIAVYEKEDHRVLQDKSEVYQIAVEYAHGGMDQLYKQYTSPGDFFSEISSEIIQYGIQRLADD